MCYAKPGPRCHGHAMEKLEAVKSKTATTFRARENALAEMHTLRDADPQGYKSNPAYKKAETKFTRLNDEYQDLSDKIEVASLEVDATKKGMEELQGRIDDRQPEKGVDEQMLKAQLERRLAQAHTLYSSRMVAYDQDNGTVDGRQPSRHGTPEGIAELRKKFKDISDKREKAFDENDSAKFMKYNTEHRKIREQLAHAEMTRNYVKNGLLKSSVVDKHKVEKELASLERRHQNLSDSYHKKRNEYQQGPLKSYNDFIAARKDIDIKDWSDEDRKTRRRLKDELNEFKYHQLETLSDKIKANTSALVEKSRELDSINPGSESKDLKEILDSPLQNLTFKYSF